MRGGSAEARSAAGAPAARGRASAGASAEAATASAATDAGVATLAASTAAARSAAASATASTEAAALAHDGLEPAGNLLLGLAEELDEVTGAERVSIASWSEEKGRRTG